MALLGVVLAMLAALVLSFSPSKTRFLPAPLVASPPGCATGHAFVPTNVTNLPDPGLKSLPAPARSRALLRINMEQCGCGCSQSIVACRLADPECATSRKLLEQTVSPEEK